MIIGHSYKNPYNQKYYRLGDIKGTTARLYDGTMDIVAAQVEDGSIAWNTLTRVSPKRAK